MSAATRAKTARERANIAIRMLKSTPEHRSFGRAFDDCFEMNDGDEVARIIAERAKADPALLAILRARGFHWPELGIG